MKPSEAVAFTVSDAVAVFPAPMVTWLILPTVVLPMVKVTGPVKVPAVCPLIVADKVMLLPKGTDVGLAVTAVVVG